MTTEKLLHQFEGIKETVTRYDSLLSSIKSPAVIYEEKTVEIRGRITQLWASWASTPASEISRLQDNVVDLGGRLKELEINRDANVQDEEKIYYQTLQKTLDALCYELLGLIGPAKIHSYLRNTSSEIPVDHASNNPIVTCQPPTATPQGTIFEEASTPSEMLKNNQKGSESQRWHTKGVLASCRRKRGVTYMRTVIGK
ncbi:hypothetical protein BHE90_017024 [Fusarium euwallaceae]|uniref:Uncharacterized protein n=1 Tax=Fusarium euwallaceae TaxID=1147111 RepID=A0A430KYQ5_9HYPO|nr:hypothetical protein BHE90_017024 [Fusarium euwallaceae]